VSIRWDCDKSGCYKDKCIPDWGFLDKCFPRGIKATDIDGTVEIGRRFLFFEWKTLKKGVRGTLSKGQRLYFERLTMVSSVMTVFIFYGDVEARTIEEAQWIREGTISSVRSVTMSAVQAAVERWATGELF